MWIIVVVIIALAPMIMLPYAPVSTAILGTVILLVGIYLSDKILDQLTGGEKKDLRFTNFVKPHMELEGQTSAEAAGIGSRERTSGLLY